MNWNSARHTNVKKSPPYNKPRRPKAEEVQLYSFLNLGARMGCVDNATHRLLYPQRGAKVPSVKEAGWAPGPVWTGAEYLA